MEMLVSNLGTMVLPSIDCRTVLRDSLSAQGPIVLEDQLESKTVSGCSCRGHSIRYSICHGASEGDMS